ncbi:hypothetical protein ACP4OV_021063 [Aristida adscensionis]
MFSSPPAASTGFRASRREEQQRRCEGAKTTGTSAAGCGMSSMAWYTLPEGGTAVSAGDEFFDNQSATWSIWDFDLTHEKGSAQCSEAAEPQESNQPEKSSLCSSAASSGCTAGPSEEQHDGAAPLEPQCKQQTEDIFLSHFSDEEMRRMDGPFEALDMFPGSMHSLLSYENMLSGVLTGSEDQETKVDQNGINAMDTCGFPMFSHDTQNVTTNADGLEILADSPSIDNVGMRMAKRSRSSAYAEVPNMEAEVLEELEDVVLQLTKKTRICFRDAFYRLAEGSKAKCSAADGATESGLSSTRPSFEHPDSSMSRVSEPGGCPEKETNAIDRTVADLTLKPPHGCCADDSAPAPATAEAQSTSSWITRA